MKLMHAAASPYARKAWATAIELGLGAELEIVPTAVAPGKDNSEYTSKINPLTKIPAMELEDGSVLYDSTVICEYLDARAGGGRLIPAGGEARWRVLTQHALAQGMTDAALLIRYETFLRPEEARWDTWLESQRQKIKAGLQWFENNPDSLEGPLNLAQIALGVLLGYLDFRFGDDPWRPGHPKLEAWYADASKRDCFAQTVPS